MTMADLLKEIINGANISVNEKLLDYIGILKSDMIFRIVSGFLWLGLGLVFIYFVYKIYKSNKYYNENHEHNTNNKIIIWFTEMDDVDRGTLMVMMGILGVLFIVIGPLFIIINGYDLFAITNNPTGYILKRFI